jgi:hypothetical protein
MHPRVHVVVSYPRTLIKNRHGFDACAARAAKRWSDEYFIERSWLAQSGVAADARVPGQGKLQNE